MNVKPKHNVISGIYFIENIINGKKYIGSSNDLVYRNNKHFSELKCNHHRNKHLQSAYNKYGKANFKFIIVENCPINKLIIREQYYLDNADWSILYNKAKQAGGGGGELTAKEVYLIDLFGNIVSKYESGRKLAEYFNRVALSYSTINTSSIINRQYRAVTPDFYKNNKDV